MKSPMIGAAARTPDSGARAAPWPTGVVSLLDGLGAVALLTRDAVHAALRRPPEWRTIAEQLEQIGWRSLSIIGDLVGILGGLLLSVTELNVSGEFYLNSLVQVLYLRDVFSGIGKSFFFAYFIGIIACLNGLNVTGGADGVGRATTRTVVAASITVLISDFFLTKLFLLS